LDSSEANPYNIMRRSDLDARRMVSTVTVNQLRAEAYE